MSFADRRAISGLACGVTVVVVTACSQVAGNGDRTGITTTAGASAAAPSAARALAEAAVPIAVISQGQSQVELVPVYVNGHGPYAFLLDTGSSISSVSLQLAARLRLPRTGKFARISGVATTSKAPLVSITDWKLGRYRLAPETILALSMPSRADSVVGLLGSDELRRFGEVTIDFRHLRLHLAEP